MTGKWRSLSALGAGLAATATMITAVAGPNGTGGGPTAESILGSGSDTTIVLMLHLDGLYMISEGCSKFNGTSKPLDFSCIKPDPAGTPHVENYEHDQVHEADFLGSSTGIKQLCTQGVSGTAYIDYARSSRASGSSDCAGLHFVAYARDGISLEANDGGTTASGINGMNNPDAHCTGLGFCLTQSQVKGIYGGNTNPNPPFNACWITNWNQVGGQNVTIQIYTPQSGSGTRSAFESFLGITDSTVCIAADGQSVANHSGSVPENQNTGIASADIPAFIFPFSFAIYHTEVNNGGGYRLASIDGVAASAATIGCVTTTCTAFPYSRYVYNVFCADATKACGLAPGHAATQKTIDYVSEEGWICKPGSNENSAWVGDGGGQTVGLVDNDPNNNLSSGPHGVSPHYNANWGDIITQKINSRGFARLSIDVIGGGDINSDHCRLTTT